MNESVNEETLKRRVSTKKTLPNLGKSHSVVVMISTAINKCMEKTFYFKENRRKVDINTHNSRGMSFYDRIVLHCFRRVVAHQL